MHHNSNRFGSVIGGAINLALNARTDRIGGISVNTYAVFVAIQCLGPAVALLISAPSQVQRTDSIKPILPSNQLGFWGEIKETVALWKRPRQIVFAIMFIVRRRTSRCLCRSATNLSRRCR